MRVFRDDHVWQRLRKMTDEDLLGAEFHVLEMLSDLVSKKMPRGAFLFSALEIYRCNFLPAPSWLVDELLEHWKTYQGGRGSSYWCDLVTGIGPEPEVPKTIDETLGLHRSGHQARTVKAEIQEKDYSGPIIRMHERLSGEGWVAPLIFDEIAKRLPIHVGSSRVKEIFYKYK